MWYELPDRSLSILRATVRNIPVLTPDEVRALCVRMQAGGSEGENACLQLIRHNLRLVLRLATKWAAIYNLPTMDLFQEGYMHGLVNAVSKYNPDLGNKFSTYATHWIEEAIRDYAAENHSIIRRPRYMFEAIHKFWRVESQLRGRLGTEHVSTYALADELGVSSEKVRRIRAEACAVYATPLEEPLSPEENDGMLADVLVNPEGLTVTDDISIDERAQVIACVLATLSERDRAVLVARYGLDGSGPRTLEEVGKILGLTSERARQLQVLALKKLHDAFVTMGFREGDLL